MSLIAMNPDAHYDDDQGLVVRRSARSPGDRLWPAAAAAPTSADSSVPALVRSLSCMTNLRQKLIVVDENLVDDDGASADRRSALLGVQQSLSERQRCLAMEIEHFLQRCRHFDIQKRAIVQAFPSMNANGAADLQLLNSDLVKQYVTAAAHEHVLEREVQCVHDEMRTIQAAISRHDRRQAAQSSQLRRWISETSSYNRLIQSLLAEQERRCCESVRDLDQCLARVPARLRQLERALADAHRQIQILSLDKSRTEELLFESIVTSTESHDGITDWILILERHLDERAPWLGRQFRRTVWLATLPITISATILKQFTRQFPASHY